MYNFTKILSYTQLAQEMKEWDCVMNPCVLHYVSTYVASNVSFCVQLKYIFGGLNVRFGLCNARRICAVALGTGVFYSTVFRQFSRAL